MPIIALGLSSPLASVYNEDLFHLLVETHLDWLRQQPETLLQMVTAHEADKYCYDLYGFLKQKGVDDALFWTTMRLSDLTSPTDFSRDTRSIYIPSATALDKLRQLHLTSRTVIGKK